MLKSIDEPDMLLHVSAKCSVKDDNKLRQKYRNFLNFDAARRDGQAIRTQSVPTIRDTRDSRQAVTSLEGPPEPQLSRPSASSDNAQCLASTVVRHSTRLDAKTVKQSPLLLIKRTPLGIKVSQTILQTPAGHVTCGEQGAPRASLTSLPPATVLDSQPSQASQLSAPDDESPIFGSIIQQTAGAMTSLRDSLITPSKAQKGRHADDIGLRDSSDESEYELPNPGPVGATYVSPKSALRKRGGNAQQDRKAFQGLNPLESAPRCSQAKQQLRSTDNTGAAQAAMPGSLGHLSLDLVKDQVKQVERVRERAMPSLQIKHIFPQSERSAMIGTETIQLLSQEPVSQADTSQMDFQHYNQGQDLNQSSSQGRPDLKQSLHRTVVAPLTSAGNNHASSPSQETSSSPALVQFKRHGPRNSVGMKIATENPDPGNGAPLASQSETMERLQYLRGKPFLIRAPEKHHQRAPFTTYLTEDLDRIKESKVRGSNPKPMQFWNPRVIARRPRQHERGCWMFKIPSKGKFAWSSVERDSFFKYLVAQLTNKDMGFIAVEQLPASACAKGVGTDTPDKDWDGVNPSDDWMRLYCHGEVYQHAWILLLMASQKRVLQAPGGLRWVTWAGQDHGASLIRMPGPDEVAWDEKESVRRSYVQLADAK